MTSDLNLEVFIKHGFIEKWRQRGVKEASARRQLGSTETETETEYIGKVEETSKRGEKRKAKAPDWYIRKMKKAFRAAEQRLVGNNKITEKMMQRQVEICCQEIGLEFRNDVFLRIYHDTK